MSTIKNKFINLETSNYWDDFKQRVVETCEALQSGQLPPLRRLTVHLTEGCNLRCSYCNMCFAPATMEQRLARKIVREYAKAGGQTIHFTGGEPTVVPYLDSLCYFAKDLGLVTSANTNAYHYIDTTNIDKLKASFDTPDPVKCDKIVGLDGAFERIVSNLRRYSVDMRGKMLSITAVLNKQTFRDMLALAIFVHNNFDIYNLYYSNYKGDNPEFAFTDAEIAELFAEHIPVTLEYLKNVDAEYSHRQLALYRPHDFRDTPFRFEFVPCAIQLSEMTIGIDGECHNCSHLFRDGVRIPNSPNVAREHIGKCFSELKKNINWSYCIDEHCLSGCNTNLIGFNKTVQSLLEE